MFKFEGFLKIEKSWTLTDNDEDFDFNLCDVSQNWLILFCGGVVGPCFGLVATIFPFLAVEYEEILTSPKTHRGFAVRFRYSSSLIRFGYFTN